MTVAIIGGAVESVKDGQVLVRKRIVLLTKTCRSSPDANHQEILFSPLKG